MVYGMGPFELILTLFCGLAALLLVVYLLVRVVRRALKK